MGSLNPLETFSGVVQEKLVGAGSKSEHKAIVLKTNDGKELELRLVHGNSFSDPALQHLVGSRISVKGCTHQDTPATLFVMQVGDIVVIGPPGKPAHPPRKAQGLRF